MKTKKVEFANANNKAKPTFGIDLGTTNSAISLVSSGNTAEVLDLNGRKTLPSCVMWLGGNNFIVGEEAYEKKYLPSVKYSVKRHMGTHDNIVLEHNGEKRTFTPEEISAEILKELCRRVEPTYGKVEDVVITVPAYFTNTQVEATRKAGELAGLNVISTFREPTAAALCYVNVNTDEQDKKILVYDLGGGTFDVSLVSAKYAVVNEHIDSIYGFEEEVKGEVSNGVALDVLKKIGDMHLGGDDIDDELLNIYKDKLKEKGINISDVSKETYEYVKLKLEQYKKSKIEGVTLRNDIKMVDGTVLKDTDIYMSYADFFEATRVIYDRTKKLLEEVLDGESNIDYIVLVGGSTKSDNIKSLLRQDFPGVIIHDALNPDEAVALGAGLQAKLLTHGDKSIQVYDILPLGIGVLANGRVSKLIKKNQYVPYSATKNFVTVEDDQEFINVDVYQGNSNIAEECTFIGRLHIDDIPKAPKGDITVTVTLNVNADGLLKCKATVGSITKEVELVNMFKGNAESPVALDKRKQKKLVRWRKQVLKVKDAKHKEELFEQLDKFEHGEDNEKELLNMLKLYCD